MSHTPAPSAAPATPADGVLLAQVMALSEPVRRGAALLCLPGFDADFRAGKFAQRPPAKLLTRRNESDWLDAWWAHHLVVDPARALSCFDPMYLLVTLEGHAAAVVEAAGSSDGRHVSMTRLAVKHAEQSAGLPDRVVVCVQRSECSARVAGDDVPVLAERRHELPLFFGDLRFRVTEALVVPHVLAAGLLRHRLAVDAGVAGQVDKAQVRKWLETEPRDRPLLAA